MFYPICAESEIIEGQFVSKKISDLNLLLIKCNSKVYIIENKCGHFGLPLDTGSLVGNTIVCRQHGISFDLSTGEVSNRPYENCVPIKTYSVVNKDGFAGVELT